MRIVLDKSFLQGSSANLIKNLCLQHQLIMPEVLFLEILTTKSENMFKCFKKFPQIENPVELVPNVGSLLRYEIENNRPCSPIETQFLKIRFVFNELLAKDEFVFTEQQKDTLEEWKKSTTYDTGGFIEKAIAADGWFPALRSFKPGDSINPISDAILTVATKNEFIRKIYNQLRNDIYANYNILWPEPSKIGPEWILFRHLQVHLLAAIEYIRKFGKEPQPIISKRLENEYIDIDYCIIGTIADGLATRDKTMSKFYKVLCKNKGLIS